MKAKFGSIIVAGSGKIGGHVVSKNRSGAYIRTRVKPTNPQTSYQVNARATFSAASSAWASLTAAQRSAWNASSALQARQNSLGDTVMLSGKALFVSCYINLSLCGVTPLTNPVNPTAGFSFSTITMAADNSDQNIVFTFSAAIPATHKILVFATPSLSPGLSFVKPYLRNFTLLSTSDTSPKNLQSPYLLRLGVIGAAGQRIHFTFVSIELTSGIATYAGSGIATIAS